MRGPSNIVGGGRRLYRLRAATGTLIACVCLALLSACGQVNSGTRAIRAQRGEYTTYEPSVGTVLVKMPLRDGHVLIGAKSFTHDERVHWRLTEGVEVSRPPESYADSRVRVEGVETGPPIDYQESGTGVLQLDVNHECVGAEPYALAYGMLRNPHDHVAVREGHHEESLQKLSIPTAFHPDGVLVYALLGRSVATISVRSPAGRVLASEEWRGNNGIKCSS